MSVLNLELGCTEGIESYCQMWCMEGHAVAC